jgi:hypothetical protein
MRERPLLLTGPMVRAVLAGAKAQARQTVKPQPPAGRALSGFCTSSTRRADEGKAVWEAGAVDAALIAPHRVRCPYGLPGDRLWVRETFALENTCEYAGDPGIAPPLGPVRDNPWEIGGQLIPRYRASEPDTDLMIAPSEDGEGGMRWTPNVRMPRWASRIVLAITDIRVERLQDISELDAQSEGFPAGGNGHASARDAFRMDWEQGGGSWHSNPWVWVVAFRHATP